MNLPISTSRRIRMTALGAVAAAGLAGAGVAIAPVADASGALPECGTPDLGFALVQGSPGAGQRYADVVLTNRSGRTCTVTGYGGLALLGAPGQGVPTDLRRDPSPAPRTVPLAPGRSAHSLLHWSAVPAGDEPGAACEPTAVTVVITPPDETTSALRPWRFGSVCEHGRIDQQSYAPGPAVR